MDRSLAGIMLLLGLPFIFAIILLIKLGSPGPAIFAQHRLGYKGQVFVCYKFRSMYWDQPGILEQYLLDNPGSTEKWDKYAKLKYDPRVTPLGRWLRRFSLDELPQLINVIKGDMSLVGPRPYLVTEKDRMGEYAETILSVLPGLSGLWQVKGRNEIDFACRLQMDAWYAKNRSQRLDLFIMLQTLPTIIYGRGAY
ncbi:sugar transferase [Syntrophomonas palmitatica]|uniref:sugar transferase n=1 Tax=Syntrophomonas palmitatica TaxID=402877 RepID=UPI0006D2A366|nr:sugar transferase [Syntrophomonas palmitatica]